ncbi:MAG: NAD-dependent deacylase [Bacteroidia bacterium]
MTGAGISAESGLKTFRDAGGLWEGHDVMAVASPEGFARNPDLVLRFYNERRAQAQLAQPNAAHLALVRLEEKYHVDIITQNVDDLHERAGSSHIVHLHGELNKARSVMDEYNILEIRGDIHLGDMGPDGYQLRPHIVWFGEPVPEIARAAELMTRADVVLIIGTSMAVYPAAGLIDYAPKRAHVYVIDPKKPPVDVFSNQIEFIVQPATTGVSYVVDLLLSEAGA